MNIPTKTKEETLQLIQKDFFDHLWQQSWTYIKTVVDVVHEPVMILDQNFRIITANDSFYHLFKVTPKETENKIIYKLGNGQWNIPAFKKLLEDILPKDTFFKGFEVDHQFPVIGHKVMMLNARQIHFKDDPNSKVTPCIILLAMEDITALTDVAHKIGRQTNQIRTRLIQRVHKLEMYILKLEKQAKGL